MCSAPHSSIQVGYYLLSMIFILNRVCNRCIKLLSFSTYWKIILEFDVGLVKELDLVILSQNPWPKNFADSFGASAFRI